VVPHGGHQLAQQDRVSQRVDTPAVSEVVVAGLEKRLRVPRAGTADDVRDDAVPGHELTCERGQLVGIGDVQPRGRDVGQVGERVAHAVDASRRGDDLVVVGREAADQRCADAAAGAGDEQDAFHAGLPSIRDDDT